MPIIEIGDKRVEVGEDFLSLPPDEQQRTVDEIEAQLGGATPQPGRDESFFGRIDNLGRAAARGLPLVGGLTDEFSAGMNTGFGLWGDYNKAVAGERERDQQFDAAHPTVSTLAGLGGGIVGGAAMLPAKLFQGATTLGSVGRSAATGGALGAAETVLRDNEFAPTAFEVGVGTAVGGGAGGAGPLVAKGAGAAWNAIGEFMANRGVDAKAIRNILSELQLSGMTPQQAAQRRREIHPEVAMVGDVNPGMQTMTAATGMAETGANTQIGERLYNRRQGSQGRMDAARESAFGQAIDPYDMRLYKRNAAEALAYDDVLRGAPRLPDNLDDLLAQELTFPGANMSLSNRRVMGDIFSQVDDALLADTPEMTARRLLDIRKNLDAQIVYDPRAFSELSSADKATQQPLREARRVIDGVLKQHIPGIRELDARYADVASAKSAYDEGRRALGDGPNAVSPNEFAARNAELTPEQQALRNAGMSSEVDREVTRARNAGNEMGSYLRGWNRDKVATAVGNQNADELARAVEGENVMLGTSRMAEPGYGSRTANLGAAFQRLYGQPAVADAITNAAVTGSATGVAAPAVAVPAAAAAGIASLMRGMLGRVFKPDPRVVRATGDRLTQQGGGAENVIAELMRRAQAQSGREQNAQSLDDMVRMFGRLLTPSAAQAPSQ